MGHTTEQLETWEGDWGNKYTKRNPVDWVSRVIGFNKVFTGLTPSSVLEVGCNRGHNLIALSKVLDARIVGIEPNAFALEIARASKLDVVKGNAYGLPFDAGAFDAVMTVAVLSHIHIKDLGRAIDEIYRVSNKYIVFAEYYAIGEVETPYTGRLWRRNYAQTYMDHFGKMGIVSKGFLGHKDGFDKLSYWILEKRNNVKENRQIV